MAETGGKNPAVAREEKVLSFWKENHIFEKSMAKTSPKGEYVVYEGPPTANGRPGIHHLESRSFKDALPRYKTMRGYRVDRRAGWDTHGLPVELEVEKELGFSGKKQIEEYGIAAFNKKCRESVMKYVEEWSRFTDRIGYWVDQEKAYFTFNLPFMESVFSIVKKVNDDGRLYKDYRIVPWCARCGTALSSHELAQGYQDVKDLSVTVKFELTDEPGTYVLAWTTTPWTLLGNVALAVGKDISYGTYTNGSEKVIVAVQRAEVLGEGWTLQNEMAGAALVGRKYKRLFDYLPSIAGGDEKAKIEKAYQIYAADFVTTEDGTGVVHTAVMYGADDFALGTQLGLPKVHTVGADGNFVAGTGSWAGRFVKDEETTVDIIKDLAGRGVLFSKAKYEHSYPFCWRCKTPLIYYARDSWYIRMQDLRDKLLSANAGINWEPSHIREGRMGEWLSNVKDWALSRERYWGTPLPIWEAADGTERFVAGSLDDLQTRVQKSGNKYFTMRHGEAENNILQILSGSDRTIHPLTEVGKQTVKAQAEALCSERIDFIYASPLRRTRETAAIVRETINGPEVILEERLREYFGGEFDGRSIAEYEATHPDSPELFTKAPKGGETLNDVRHRVGDFLYELERTHQNKNILIVSHGDPIWLIHGVARGLTAAQIIEQRGAIYPDKGRCVPLPFVPLSHNEDYELDLHRPYIDDLVLLGDSGKELRRVKEVMDVWFDSGAMPFGQDHYPFENKVRVEGKGYPADFISEAIDQTRGWFYTLLAVGALMGRGAAYKNVICLGHLLDEKGQKMSKSKGNVVNPWEAIEQYGVDTLRFWMYFVNQPGDSKNFDEKTVKEAGRVLSWFENSAKFYELFKTDTPHAGKTEIIDDWMRARTNETIEKVTKAMDEYRLYDAARTLAGLFEDLSQWYVRRVRDRARDADVVALRTLRETLHVGARLLAPFSPFLAEEVFSAVKSNTDAESVHLAAWPEVKKGLFTFAHKKEAALIASMARLREEASEALMLRQKSGFKVRQTLASFSTPASFEPALATLLADEVNVQSIVPGAKERALDTNLTPELVALGDEREKARAVADARKQMNLSPKDQVTVTWGEGQYTVELSTGTLAFEVKRNET